MAAVSRFYITTPIYYINAEPHLGHAYTTMVADAVARAHRLLGDDVFFLTGTDEHGQKVERAAQKAGLSPEAFADHIARKFHDLLPALNISNDDFIRTTEPRHHAAAQELWRQVRDRGFIYKDKYEGWYCTVDEIFVPETQLVAGRCGICGNPVERIAEESYFFRLSRFEQPLLDHYRAHPDFVTPAGRRNEVLTFLEGGLEDLSISRTSFTWGIPVPDDPAHVMYVWFDALTNYMTAAGYGVSQPAAAARFARYWPADVHLIGKEIVRQHAIYWPAFLLAAGLPLPRQIVSHGWWLMEGAKMSKSKGNVVRPHEYVDRFGLDAVRYFVFREMVFGQDASFGDEAILTRYNSDLANDLGNLVSRTTTMAHRYCDGVVPSADRELLARPPERELSSAVGALVVKVKAAVASFQSSTALRDIWEVIGATNRYIVTREPWQLAKSPDRRAELDAALYAAADALRVIAELIRPFMPATGERTLRMLGVEPEAASWTSLRPGTLEPGTTLGELAALFPRIEHTVEELRAMAADTNDVSPAPGSQGASTSVSSAAASAGAAGSATTGTVAATTAAADRISIDDFMKVELRVARVLSAEPVPKSSKLLKLQVDTGADQRTIVAGIAESYEPAALVGRTIVVVTNLKPAKLMGVESNGMVLAASPEGGKALLLSFDVAPVPGTRVR
ncbi:MAG: methionine--tRNA ligase [Luteitalea sp.]|nr:methionine--tRNA ligase [Luteitalea sp.]